jgi:tetratricopeptide (TPR) repeat protein
MTAAARDFLGLLGFVFLEHGQAEKAVAVFEALSALAPDDAAASQRLGFAYLLGRRHAEALRHAEAHLDRFPTDPDLDAVRRLRGRALWHLGRPNEARRAAARPGGNDP